MKCREVDLKLYNENSSPFASRVRIQIYHKKIPVEICAPPGGLRTETYRKLTKLGLVPALDTGDRIISESLAIMEYLEDCYPENPLRPETAGDKAHMRMISLFHDLNVQPVLGKIFRGFMKPDIDQQAIITSSEKLAEVLIRLEGIMSDDYASGSELSIADCVLVPGFRFMEILPEFIEAPPVLQRLEKLPYWWETVSTVPAVTQVAGEFDRAVRGFLASVAER